MIATETLPIRNLALVGHGHVGKTSLADLLLFESGISKRAGSVDDGTSMLDVDDEEKQHKLSVSSHTAHFDRGSIRFNIIDTPGYPDFLGQVIGAMRAVETAALCIDAHKGIEVNTRKTWQLAGEEHLARVIVLTKCDGDNIDFPALIDSIQETFGQGCVPFNVPVGIGANLSGVVSTLNPKADAAGAMIDPKSIYQSVVDSAVEADEELMEKYFEEGELSQEDLENAITAAMVAGTLTPIFCMSTKMNIGIAEFVEAMAKFGPSPIAMERHATDADGADFVLDLTEDGELVAQVFKTRIDPFVSKMSYIRIFSGKLGKDATIHDTRSGATMKVHQILDVQGNEHQSITEAKAGDIVAVAKMDDLQVGDTLTNGNIGVALPPINFPEPMIGLAVEPKSRADQQKISGALHKIEDEDPTFVVTRDDQTKEIVMRGMSELHLSIVEERLKGRDKVEIVTHQPKVPYRETISAAAEGSYRHKKQSGGSGQFAEVHMRVTALPQDINPEEYFVKSRFANMREYHYDPEFNFAFVDRISGGSIPNQFIPAVEKGVHEKMTDGVIAGYQVQDVCVELFFGKDHPVDSNETAFKTAGRNCFREIFQQARPTLLEPIVHMEIYVPDEFLGDISSDLNTRRGRVEGMEGQPGGYQIIRALAPLAGVMTYARVLSSIAGGRGSFTLEMSHYEPVPPNEQAKIIAQATQQEEG